mgnify:CR=1 FL=1
MKNIFTRVFIMLIIAVLLLQSNIAFATSDEVTVDSVTAQLEAIDTLQQMQKKRDNYIASGHYDTSTTNQTVIDNHTAKRTAYEEYLTQMFAARAAAQTAYDSLTAQEQAQIDPALVAKLDNELENNILDFTAPVTPGEGEYIYEYVHNAVGHGYEVSPYMVSGNIPQTFMFTDTSDGKTEFTPNGLYEYGKSNYDVAYCADFDTPAIAHHHYRRINLEDSTYFSDAAAEKIRAIVQNSYPFISMEEMKENLKEKGLSEDFVDSLTRGDIISGIQLAIWWYANPNSFSETDYGYFASVSITKNTGIYFTPYHDYTNEIWEWLPPKRTRSYDGRAEYRVNNLAYFLTQLEGVKPNDDQIVVSNVQVGRLDLLPRYEDVYSVGLHVLLNSGADTSDDITMYIRSYSEDENGNVTTTATNTLKVDSKKEYTPTINARYGDTIEVVIEGTQNLEKGVYLYEAEGGRTASQSMVGVADGTTAVRASKSFTFNRDIEKGLRIYKKSSIDMTPISDITFNVYKVEAEDGEVLNDTPTAAEIVRFAVEENLVGTIVTDSTGYGSLALPNNGKYLVVEEHNAQKVEAPADPFYITIPWAVEQEVNGEIVIEHVDVVTVYPKNTPVTPPPPPPPPPPVTVYGVFKIIKFDNNNTTDYLGGAEFQVYRAATSEDTETETIVCNGVSCAVVPVTIDGESIILVTDSNGSATSPELVCGTYYIKETKAPFGYVLPKESSIVTVKADVENEIACAYIGNDRGIVLPATGGIGVNILIILGSLLMLISASFLVIRKRLSE